MIARPLSRDISDRGATITNLYHDYPVTARKGYALMSRLRDIIVASIGLIALSPLFLIIALLIKLTSPGDVIFRQDRCGVDGRLFRCYKFRTMVPDAHWMLQVDPSLKASFTRQWKLVDDPRVTPVGKFLRKTSLDELPQLWNVLKGDMSLVGPRPVQADELVERYGHHAEIVTLVRPGMTGLWQVSGRSMLPYEQRVALDVEYVHRRGFIFDLLILVLTIPAVLVSRGAQ